MRPILRFLSDALAQRIASEAIDVLCTLGVEVHNPEALSLLADHGARVDAPRHRAVLTREIIEKALRSAPGSFSLYDVQGHQTHRFSGHAVCFAPGSTALHVLDCRTGKIRKPLTKDYVDYAKVASGLGHIALQSTAMIPADVPAGISDSYRLLLSLLYCEKPVVTGAFSIESFEVMKDLQIAVRGTEKALQEKPLAVFTCCPTSPLRWEQVGSQNLIDCARWSIPVEVVAMPLCGFTAPVTLAGTLVQHAAETLSGVVIAQLVNPGTPVLYGGSSAVFDVRHETTPMGAIETMMIACAANEVGKHLGLPTQAYVSLSDSKRLDAQAGMESGMGAVLAALAGINLISGPGMLDFESCQSLEKLVLDNELCGMALRLIGGIEPKEDFPAVGILRELLAEGHLLIADHTRRYLKEELLFPGPAIDRSHRARWEREGSPTLDQRAQGQVERLLETYRPSTLAAETKRAMVERMEHEARRYGQERLPVAE